MKVIIVGGVAGGASCAARLRRLDESVNTTRLYQGSLSAEAVSKRKITNTGGNNQPIIT